MEPVAHIHTAKRSYDKTTDWDLCIFCQKKEPKKPTRKLGDISIARVRQAVADHKKYNDHANWDTVERIDNIDEVTMDILNHKDCYTTFTSNLHITRLKAKYESKTQSQPN